MKNETVTTSTKQTSETPELATFGKFEDLTLGNGANVAADTGVST